jgi:hypothetical protein
MLRRLLLWVFVVPAVVGIGIGIALTASYLATP